MRRPKLSNSEAVAPDEEVTTDKNHLPKVGINYN
jgi:hypothetical protein